MWLFETMQQHRFPRPEAMWWWGGYSFFKPRARYRLHILVASPSFHGPWSLAAEMLWSPEGVLLRHLGTVAGIIGFRQREYQYLCCFGKVRCGESMSNTMVPDPWVYPYDLARASILRAQGNVIMGGYSLFGLRAWYGLHVSVASLSIYGLWSLNMVPGIMLSGEFWSPKAAVLRHLGGGCWDDRFPASKIPTFLWL